LKLPGIFLGISQFVQKNQKKIGKLKRKKSEKTQTLLRISYRLAIASKYFIKKKNDIP